MWVIPRRSPSSAIVEGAVEDLTYCKYSGIKHSLRRTIRKSSDDLERSFSGVFLRKRREKTLSFLDFSVVLKNSSHVKINEGRTSSYFVGARSQIAHTFEYSCIVKFVLLLYSILVFITTSCGLAS